MITDKERFWCPDPRKQEWVKREAGARLPYQAGASPELPPQR